MKQFTLDSFLSVVVSMIPERAIGRLSLYRRILDQVLDQGRLYIFSHELAKLSGNKPAQVRRDLMVVGCSGCASRGYDVQDLSKAIDASLDGPDKQRIALVGVGNLGRAVLHYFFGRRKQLEVAAAFDRNPDKVNRVLHGCRVYRVEDLDDVIRREGIQLGVITVPGSEAQGIADLLVQGGVSGILNFAPVPLRVPPGVFVEDIDITMAIEKVAYLTHEGISRSEEEK